MRELGSGVGAPSRCSQDDWPGCSAGFGIPNEVKAGPAPVLVPAAGVVDPKGDAAAGFEAALGAFSATGVEQNGQFTHFQRRGTLSRMCYRFPMKRQTRWCWHWRLGHRY